MAADPLAVAAAVDELPAVRSTAPACGPAENPVRAASGRTSGTAPAKAPGRALSAADGTPAARRRKALVLIALAVLVVASFLFSLTLGRYDMDFGQVLALFAAPFSSAAEATDANVFFTIRLPRVLAALVVGAALSGAGCAFQGIFKNPMVSPDLLGASAGACFGAALGILLSFGSLGVEIAAFVAGVAAVFVSYGLSSVIGRRMSGVLVLVLSGLVVGNLFQAFTSAVKFLADPNSQLPEITFWLMGGLSSVREGDLAGLLAAFAVGAVGIMVLRWRLNVMALGDEEALSLGVNVKRTRLAVIACATLLTSASVAVAGMVGWVGLIVPHLARFLVGSDHRALVPASMLLGGAFLMLVDDVCRSIYTTEIPLSILTAILGAPLFVYLICRQRKSL
ncbi:FecCD family ABC transporter permease [Gordonibacter massiliensis (ex Traore et al. 2017)]|uniref:FecCD family ABC transporter permease n=1 Tax=Gordonibacter massiliensis (ex Traore et al. 2017) TaxID=1841863 RepID=UPI001C8B462E|nr:iron ABC transporter permease [Gordonibacter massiliensis (ex Traore et al. 2017)]MBX9034175.1 iron ABC transporter permease [Gordonibacter massiliensis (ex Traore et al. 2017)]